MDILVISSCISSDLCAINTEEIKQFAMFKILIACAVFATAYANPAGPPHPGPGYHAPIKYEPRPYAYEYGVQDKYYGVDFGQNEKSDGKAVYGSYHVLLPDGRVQNVKYTADHYTGYVADVAYSGVAAPYHPPKHAKSAPIHLPPPPPVHAPIHPVPHKG